MNIESGNYILEAANSSLGWKAAFKVGASHNGTIAIKSGNLNITDSDASGKARCRMKKVREN